MRSEQRGDTIIEVLLAVTVFSLLAVGTMVIMNRGMAIAERSLEMTLVRQQIDGQADLIRYIHSRHAAKDETYEGAWRDIIATVDAGTVTDAEGLGKDVCPDRLPGGAFTLRPPKAHSSSSLKNNKYRLAETYAKIVEDRGEYESHGIYVKVRKVAPSGSSSSGTAYDVYINACWDSVDGGHPQTMGTIVRLYDAK